MAQRRQLARRHLLMRLLIAGSFRAGLRRDGRCPSLRQGGGVNKKGWSLGQNGVGYEQNGVRDNIFSEVGVDPGKSRTKWGGLEEGVL